MDPWQTPLPPVVEEAIERHLLENEKRVWHLSGSKARGGRMHQALVATDRRLLIVKVAPKGRGESVRPFAYTELAFVEVSFDWSGIFEVVRKGAVALHLKMDEAARGTTSLTCDKDAVPMFLAAADNLNQALSAEASRPAQVTISGALPLRAEDIPTEIRKLTDLRDHGHINQREYDKKRLELLDRL